MAKSSPRANFIRRLKVGTKCRFRAWWCPDWTERTVTKVQTKQVAFSHPTDPSKQFCYLPFPKASEIVEPEPGLFAITDEHTKPEDRERYTLWYDFRD